MIDQSQILNLEKKLEYLPSSMLTKRQDASGNMIIQERMAILNHLKITISDSDIKLKSYICLVEKNQSIKVQRKLPTYDIKFIMQKVFISEVEWNG